MGKNLLFSLDIGTRSVVGIVGEQIGNNIKIISAERKEHHTRAMLDGQIHDVPEVAAVLGHVKNELEKKAGPLTKVAVAAAGRALYTINAEASLEVAEIITRDDELSLEFAAIQNAQHKLANSNTIDDPTLYYCVGFSTIKYTLDGIQLKTLIGQRGKLAQIEVIATFLPRQVIDSMQAALDSIGLEMSAITLEPIAAINVLIPQTMRHLNLALVDIGAGTSDVAITNNGTIIGYGMVPYAGDEITEAISQKFLLDFNVAEVLKRKILNSKQKKLSFTDILGLEHKLAPTEIIDSVITVVADLAQAIAKQILSLNNSTAPQAVLLVGGGALTPLLPEALAQALDVAPNRIAVRTAEAISGIESIPPDLQTSDAVTPLGILKIASSQNLNFINISVNNKNIKLFNLSKLTITDALLASGISIRTMQGKPGLGITLKINGTTKFLSGSMGTPAQLTLNGEKADLTTELSNNDVIVAIPGVDGASPKVKVSDFVELKNSYKIYINNTEYIIKPIVKINDIVTTDNKALKDRDELYFRMPNQLGEILVSAGFNPTKQEFTVMVNGEEKRHTLYPELLVNNNIASLSTIINENDYIIINLPPAPTVKDIVNLDTINTGITIYFNNKPFNIGQGETIITVNNEVATGDCSIADNDVVTYETGIVQTILISDVLLATNYQPPAQASRIEILLNSLPAEYTSVVKPGDKIDVIVTP